jgi:hypothetical protein
MPIRIRPGNPADAPALAAIKAQLPFQGDDGSTTSGGFLLGTDLDTYALYLSVGESLVAEADGRIVGFGLVFGDELLRTSAIWQRREEAVWTMDIQPFLDQPLAYFEQLAFIRGYARQALAVCYHLARRSFDRGTAAMITTTVREPVRNLAAVPYILAIGGVHAGTLQETYPGVGSIVSDIYLMTAGAFYERTRSHRFYPWLESQRIGEP